MKTWWLIGALAVAIVPTMGATSGDQTRASRRGETRAQEEHPRAHVRSTAALMEAIAYRHRGRGTDHLREQLGERQSNAALEEALARRHGLAAAASNEDSTPNPQGLWEDLLEGNRRFVADRARTRRFIPLREELSKAQQPKAVVLGCSDSRVSPELLFDKTLGDLFVVRTAGNVVDRVAIGSIEYAVEHLHSPLLVVLGHESCGAVTAAAFGDRASGKNLQAVVDSIAPALDGLKGQVETSELVCLGVRANVRRSADELVARSPILREKVQAGELTLVEAVYDLSTGEVEALSVSPHGGPLSGAQDPNQGGSRHE